MHRSLRILISAGSAAGMALYAAGVALFMMSAEGLFGKTPGPAGPVFALLLFVLSAAIEGSLMFGLPAWLLLNRRPKEAVETVFITVGFLFFIVLGVGVVAAILS